MSVELRRAYELKESFQLWFLNAKEKGTDKIGEVKEELKDFYKLVEVSEIPEIKKL